MKHIVSYSGGIGSYMTAKRVIEQYGPDDVILVFMDTNMEDEDLYRFVDQTVAHLGAEFVRLADGRDVWEVFKANRFIANSRVDICSRVLKRELFDHWLKDNYSPSECIVYLGIDWSEHHRFARAKERYKPYAARAPMCEEPYMTKPEMIQSLREIGIEPPRLYGLGYSHNNCGGFCVKAGHGQFRLLLETMPERYLYHEQKEQELRDYLSKDVSVLSRTIRGKKTPLTLREFRLEMERRKEGQGEQMQLDLEDFGGCGCFVDDSDETFLAVSVAE